MAKVNSKIFCAVIQELILNEMKSVAEIDVRTNTNRQRYSSMTRL